MYTTGIIGYNGITKLSDSHSVSKESHRHNYGLSAYIKEYTSFNVIDKDHVKKLGVLNIHFSYTNML